jgi:hypothetical protein
MDCSFLTLLLCLAKLATFAISTRINADQFVYIDNGNIKLGVDLSRGGSIGWLGPSNNPNLSVLNLHDEGREVQGSFYSGPVPYDPAQCNDPSWQNWPWNPIGAGKFRLFYREHFYSWSIQAMHTSTPQQFST